MAFIYGFDRGAAAIMAVVMATTSAGCGAVADGRDEASDRMAVSDSALAVMDGEAIFEGIFFGMGPVAKRLPEVWGAQPSLAASDDPAQRAHVAQQLRTTAARVRAGDNSPESRALAASVGSTGAALAEDIEALAENFEKEGGAAAVRAQITPMMSAVRARDATFFTRFGDAMRSGNRRTIRAALEEGGRAIEEVAAVHPALREAPRTTNGAVRPAGDAAARPAIAPGGIRGVANAAGWSNVTQGDNFIQFANVLQLGNVVQVANVVMVAVAAVIAVVAFAVVPRLAHDPALPADPEDRLKMDAVSDAIAEHLAVARLVR